MKIPILSGGWHLTQKPAWNLFVPHSDHLVKLSHSTSIQNLKNDSLSVWFETDRATLTLFCILLMISFQFPFNLLFRSLNFSTKYEDSDDGICLLHSYIGLLDLEVLLSRLSCAVIQAGTIIHYGGSSLMEVVQKRTENDQ